MPSPDWGRRRFDGRIRKHFTPKRPLVDGIRFDSEAEAVRYGQLNLRQMAGEIRDLQVHVKLPMAVNGKDVVPSGKFTVDFKYWEGGEWIYEDAKPGDRQGRPMMDREAKLKIAVCEAVNGIEIRCIGVRTR